MERLGRPPHPDVLTPPEWQVLELLRERLSNEEIAARLGISVAGVKYHVSEILGKLRVATRADAAAWREAGTEAPRPVLLPLLLRRRIAPFAAGVSALAAAGAVIAILVWGTLRTGVGRVDDNALRDAGCVSVGLIGYRPTGAALVVHAVRDISKGSEFSSEMLCYSWAASAATDDVRTLWYLLYDVAQVDIRRGERIKWSEVSRVSRVQIDCDYSTWPSDYVLSTLLGTSVGTERQVVGIATDDARRVVPGDVVNVNRADKSGERRQTTVVAQARVLEVDKSGMVALAVTGEEARALADAQSEHPVWFKLMAAVAAPVVQE